MHPAPGSQSGAGFTSFCCFVNKHDVATRIRVQQFYQAGFRVWFHGPVV